MSNSVECFAPRLPKTYLVSTQSDCRKGVEEFFNVIENASMGQMHSKQDQLEKEKKNLDQKSKQLRQEIRTLQRDTKMKRPIERIDKMQVIRLNWESDKENAKKFCHKTSTSHLVALIPLILTALLPISVAPRTLTKRAVY